MPAGSVTTTETHVSTLFFTEDRVLKMKKAVHTGFLDFTTPEARHAACRREVELNRRLAPDVYLGVADLVLEGRALEHFVVMRRLPPQRRLAALLDADDIDEQLARVAALIAEFHRGARRGPEVDRDCTVEALAELWRTGVEQLQPFVGTVLAEAEVQRLGERAGEYLAGRRSLVEQRLAAGRACDGHGDLLAEDIFCMDDGPKVLDCLEFDDHLRHGDVLADVAFLAMDLERLGRPDLAARFVEQYRAASGDSWPDSFAHHLIAYRAHVRSKVMCLRHEQGAEHARHAARSLHGLALSHLDRARVRLVLVGGAPGTGKTTVSRALAERLGAQRFSSDELRDDVVPTDAGPAGTLHEGRYDPEHVGRVYSELLERARGALARGEHVVLDASWADGARRVEARRVGSDLAAVVAEVECTCPADEASARIEQRIRTGGDASEVTAELAPLLATRRDPWPEAVQVPTVVAPAEVAHAAFDAVERIATAP